MLAPARFLLLLLLLLPSTPSLGLSTKFYKVKSFSSCTNEALSEAKRSGPEEAPLLSARRFLALGEEGHKERRTPAGSGAGGLAASYEGPSPAQLWGKLTQDKTQRDRRAQFSLSLDVPTNIMNILFDIAKAKNVRAKAAANAHLLAQVGRKK
ncbi:urocortin-3 [Sorex fumeus]|uniref:urocortin-3 n=1 Tax=Sorex fumeus TaxID=62283 RepID=UPI0024AE2ABD|nr:urocortin-3 [Sorex fumeus]